MRHTSIGIAAIGALLLALIAAAPGLAQSGDGSQPVVRMFYFYSATCNHCQAVSGEVLPPLRQKYGDRLQIREFEFDPIPNYQLMVKLEKQAGIEGGGVPEIYVGEYALVGEDVIRDQLPGIVEKYAAAGGTQWPTNDMPVVPTAAQVQPKSNANGFALAWVIMAALVAALIYAGLALVRSFRGTLPRELPGWLEWGLPVLALAGLGVSFYLAFVETQSVKAICGPVGDCNAVQSSRYSRLFGIPVGVIGVVGYVVMLATWLWGRLRSDVLATYAPLAVFGMALFGVLFSIYLTYLELFVIHAVCIWCLSQALIMALLLVLSVSPALESVAAVEDEPLGEQARS